MFYKTLAISAITVGMATYTGATDKALAAWQHWKLIGEQQERAERAKQLQTDFENRYRQERDCYNPRTALKELECNNRKAMAWNSYAKNH